MNDVRRRQLFDFGPPVRRVRPARCRLYCRGCGCVDLRACEGGCAWYEVPRLGRPGWCTACVARFLGLPHGPVFAAVVDDAVRRAAVRIS